MKWLVTTQSQVDIKQISQELLDNGLTVDDEDLVSSLGDSEMVLHATGTSVAAENARHMEGVKEVYPDSELSLY